MSEIEHYIGIIMAEGCGEEELIGLVKLLRAQTDVVYGVAMANGPEVETPKPELTRAQLGIIGRERALIDKLVNNLRRANVGHSISDWTSETKRGACFEVLIHVDDEPTGHVARVTVELDRFDSDLVETYKRERDKR